MADVSQIKLPNGSVYDLIDEKSGYITAEYIENKTDYEIPVSRVGEIVVGETAIGTDSTNFPTSKAVVDYVDERVVQEMDAIDVGVISVNGKTGSVTLSASDVGAITQSDLSNELGDFESYMQDQIPTSTSQLTNDSGFITSDSDEKLATNQQITNGAGYFPIVGDINSVPSVKHISQNFRYGQTSGLATLTLGYVNKLAGSIRLFNGEYFISIVADSVTNSNKTITLPNQSGTIALTSDIPTVPTNISSFTNDSGYLTASDIASVMSYKGTKANYAALPASGNITGDVWHLTDTGAEWAWDGSAWQELGTAIDLSNYLTISDIAAWAKASTKPTYTAAEVGALPDSTVIPSKTSDLTNDSGFLTTDSDEKLKISQASDSTDYYLILGVSNTTATTRQYDRTGLKYYRKGGTADDSNGTARLTLGNNTASNTTGWMAGYLDIYGSTAYRVTLKSGAPTTDRVITLPDASGTIALTSDIPDTSSFLTSETDPVFSASAAAGITSTDISNWNAKVSDDKTWNGVSLGVSGTYTAADQYIPVKATNALSGTASQIVATQTPAQYRIAKYDDNAYLNSTTPSANDNSTKVATTAYVDAAIPKVYSSTNTGGYLTMATLPIYNGTVE